MNQIGTAQFSTTLPRPQALAAATFLKSFLADPMGVASVVPSSVNTVRRMLAPIDWGGVRTFVEYGPGVGTFTSAILNRLPAAGRLIAIDTSATFVDHLRHSIRDSRFEVVRGSAAETRSILADLGQAGADCILSGLPFSLLRTEAR